MKKSNLKIVLVTIAVTFVFGSLASFSFSKAFKNDPTLGEKIKTAMSTKFKGDNWNVSWGPDDESNFTESTSSWSFESNTKKISLEGVDSSVEVKESSTDKITVLAEGRLNNKRATNLLETKFSSNKLSIETNPRTSKDVKIVVEIPKTYSGDVTIETVTGTVHLTSGAPFNKMSLQTVSGDIDASGVNANDVHAETVVGDVQLKFLNSKKHQVDIETVAGDISNKLTTASDATQKVKVNTVSGDIHLE